MVARRTMTFLRNEAGVTLVEALLVVPIVLMMFAVFVEFGFAMVQINQTAKAMQLGARKLAVSDSVNSDFDPKSALAGLGTAGGTVDPSTVPSTATTSWTCTGTACDSTTTPVSAGLRRIVYGGSTATACLPLSSGTAAMCQLNKYIKLENVRVTYSLSGLGYYGRPAGAVVTIKLEVINLNFNLPVIGTLLGYGGITIPATPVTITSEDLKTTSS